MEDETQEATIFQKLSEKGLLLMDWYLHWQFQALKKRRWGREPRTYVHIWYQVFYTRGMHAHVCNTCLPLSNNPEKDGGKSQISGDKEISKAIGGHGWREILWRSEKVIVGIFNFEGKQDLWWVEILCSVCSSKEIDLLRILLGIVSQYKAERGWFIEKALER